MARKKSDDARPLLELLAKEAERRSDTVLQLQTMLALPNPKETWRGIMAVPPGTLLEKILADFRRNSDIPLELPFFSTFALLAGHLLHSGVHLEFHGDESSDVVAVDPDIWLLLLAPSGSSKSLAFETIRKAADSRVQEAMFNISGIQSSAAFFELLLENNRKLAFRDEFNEMYKQLNTGGRLDGVKDMLLRLYNHEHIEWNTKKEGTRVIKDTAICFIGMTVGNSFFSTLAPDDLLNGTTQRFLPAIASDDPDRQMVDFPIFHFHSRPWKAEWTKLLDSIKHTAYVATEEALEGYKTAFKLLLAREVDKSFYRRVLWSAHKYALMYHILRGRGGDQQLTPEDYGWAARVLLLHLNDLREMLFSSGLSPLQKVIQKTEQHIKHLRACKKPVTARALVTGVRDIRSIQEARSLLQILSEPEEPTPAAAKRAAKQAEEEAKAAESTKAKAMEQAQATVSEDVETA